MEKGGEVTRRVRVRFEEEGEKKILRKEERREGLKLSWLLVKPKHDTVSKLSSYIYRLFHLRRSCPNGIILTMDGFVLPPFESTSILKDKDIIGVKRKGKLLSTIKNGDEVESNSKLLEKQSFLLLANEEFEKESGGYLSEPDEEEEEEEQKEKSNQSGDGLYEEKSPDRDRISKKRKASKELRSPKKKKKSKRLMDKTSDQMEAMMSLLDASNGFHPGESSGTKKKNSKVKKKCKRDSTHVSVERNDHTSQPLPSSERSSPIKENDMGCGASSQVPDETEKKPSRSARRKKAKRQWLREILKAEKEQLLLSNGTCSQLENSDVQLKKKQSPEIGVNKQSVERQKQTPNCEADNEIAPDVDPVPIVIRPGHIRFEPLEEDADHEGLQQRHISAEIVQWNGITNKKKGQKWGNEKSTSWRNEPQDFIIEPSETKATEEVKSPNNSIDFDNLAPLARLPKEGDLIAYRLVELSSTWTPELTSFRVGKTSRYDSVSNMILLTPLPEYPLVIEKPDEEDTIAQPPNNNFYNEDGSLEVDFLSLVDVRMVKESDSDPALATSNGAHVHLVTNGANSSTATDCDNGKRNSTLHPEKQENAWDEISEALNAKKAELERENGWIKENAGKGGRSFRAMRGSAMGPIIARLRANNEL